MLSVAVLIQTVAASTSASRTDQALSLLLAQNVSGVAAVWTGFNATPFTAALGYLRDSEDAPMALDAVFPIASNTKLYVAVALYQLQEAGHVALNKSIAEYLGPDDFKAFGVANVTQYCPVAPTTAPGSCETITFIQLLAMTAGIEGLGLQFLPFPGSLGLVVGRYILRPLLFSPGTRFYYSNPSFMLAAYFVEKFSGLSFNEYLTRNVFRPLGLHHTEYDQGDQQFFINPKRVSEYRRFVDPTSKRLVSRGKCVEFALGSANGAGGMLSTLTDAMTWYYRLFNFTGEVGGGILSAASVYEIVKPRTPTGWGQGQYYAQGLFVVSSEGTNATVPDQITYEGMIQCSWTANFLDLTVQPYRMAQVWSNSPVFYASKNELMEASRSQYGSWWSLSAGWQQPTGLMSLAQSIAALWS